MHRALVMAAFAGLVPHLRAQPPAAFVPGQVYFSENNAEFNISRVRVFDPVSRQTSILVDETDGVAAANGLSFTPDGRRLRVMSYANSRVFDVDATGSASLVYGPNEGVIGPEGQNGMAWDAYGNYFLSSAAHVVSRFDVGGGAGTIVANTGPGGLAFAANGDLIIASTVVRRLNPQGELSVFDAEFGFNESAKTIAITANGDWLLGTQQAGVGKLYRYAHGQRESRQLLPGFFDAGSGAFTIALSADDATLWVVDNFFLYRVNPWTGDRETVAEFGQQPLVSWGRGLTVYAPPPPGDLNCDKRVNFFDIDAFLLALFDPPAYAAQFSFCRRDLADLNADGSVDFFDVDGFIDALFSAP